jgi:DNA-binding transcriptional LysR family regulator
MNGNLREITLFVAAYEEQSFTAAAQRENATQSGVSQHIRSLESRLGVDLFLRERGRVRPTPAGNSFYRSCIDVLRTYARAERTAQRFASGLTGEIVVGLMPTMTRCTIAPALLRFTQEHPNIKVGIVEGYSGALTQMVQSGDLDFAIVPAFAGTPGLRSRLFLSTPETLVAAAHCGRTHLAPVHMSELGGLKLVMPGPANTRRQTLETYCTSNGVEIANLLELDAMLATLSFVAESDWVAILPAIMMASDAEPHRFTVNPLADPPLMLDLVLVESARHALSVAGEVFLEILNAETQALNNRWKAAARLEA